MKDKPLPDIRIEANGPAVPMTGDSAEGVHEADGLHICFYEIDRQ